MKNDLDELRKQHLDSYKSALMEIVKNNTNVLFGNDIMSLFKVPPLDSMDTLKVKILECAKKSELVVDSDKLQKMLNDYRKCVFNELSELKQYRQDYLIKIIDDYNITNDNLMKYKKSDFSVINKEIKSRLKKTMVSAFEEKISKKVNTLFTDKSFEVSDIVKSITKFFSTTYLKGTLENCDFKLLVKDTILLNSINEQNDRYLFTLKNSHLFDE